MRVDLSYADKTIRRPGSAPELAVKRPGSPVRSVLRRQQTTDQHRYLKLILTAFRYCKKTVMLLNATT